MKHQKLGCGIFLSLTLCASCLCIGGEAPNLSWGVQFGTPAADFPLEVETDTLGNVYVVGQTEGVLDGQSSGKRDGFLIKFNASGGREWTLQVGSSSYDAVSGVAVYGDNTVFITGTTSGLIGAQKFGSSVDNDGFVARYDGQGNRIWIVQLGTNKADQFNRIVTDGRGNCYITGKTSGVLGSKNAGGEDVFVCKLDGLGNPLWITQFGTDKNDSGGDLTVSPEGKIYVSAITSGGFDIPSLGSIDAVLAKLDSNGALEWTRQFGSNSQDEIRGVALDGLGHVFVGGWTGGAMQGNQIGNGDAFLTCFDQDGNRSWTRQFGTTNWDGAHGMAAFPDGSGDVLIGGCWTWPTCNGWMRRYTGAGDLVWEKLIYTNVSKSTCGQSVFVDRMGDCYHIGGTDDAVYAPSLGGQDAFLVKLSSVSGIQGKTGHAAPKDFELYQNRPNPFNPETEIQYSLSKDSNVQVIIHSLSGETVAKLVDTRQEAGIHTLRWNGSDDLGMQVASGIYFCRLTSGSGTDIKKMILIR